LASSNMSRRIRLELAHTSRHTHIRTSCFFFNQT